MYSSNSRTYFSCAQRNLQPAQVDASSGSIAVQSPIETSLSAKPSTVKFIPATVFISRMWYGNAHPSVERISHAI
jgi:hypothetical protein